MANVLHFAPVKKRFELRTWTCSVCGFQFLSLIEVPEAGKCPHVSQCGKCDAMSATRDSVEPADVIHATTEDAIDRAGSIIAGWHAGGKQRMAAEVNMAAHEAEIVELDEPPDDWIPPEERGDL